MNDVINEIKKSIEWENYKTMIIIILMKLGEIVSSVKYIVMISCLF